MSSKKNRKKFVRTIVLLGSGELGRELVISLKRLGQRVIAVDRYEGAPAMQVADAFEVVNMLDASELARVVKKHQPDLVVPEIEAIRTEALKAFEQDGIRVVPTAEAAHLTMNRNAIREVAAKELGLKTARYAYASSCEELEAAARDIGFPNVIKPVMSSSGKGQSVAKSAKDVRSAWDFACESMRGDSKVVIVEEFIRFDLEITLLTVRQLDGTTLFVDPIGHRQERGDYQESWMPAKLTPAQHKKAKAMAKAVTNRMGGAGLFGVEFFIGRDGEVYFSEVSPRPHDTGMVTLVSQDLSEFDLHARAILGLPIPSKFGSRGPSASAVILSPGEFDQVEYVGVPEALSTGAEDVRIFAKPTARLHRRMGVALARGRTVAEARKKASKAAALVKVIRKD